MIKARSLLLAAVLTACGGGSNPSAVVPTTSPKGAVEKFMQAVSDSNLTAMANLWGSAGGPAARTGQPPDYERRIAVMQTYLRHESHRIASEASLSDARHGVQVEIRRQLCSWTVPFTVIRLADGSWIVNQVDLTRAGNPAKPCVPGGQDTTTRQ